jgi:aldose sugar dehydrogenase
MISSALISLTTFIGITAAVGNAAIVDKVVISGLQNPWAVVPSPSGEIWISEMAGGIKIYDAGYRLKSTLKNFTNVKAYGQGGLLDIAFHPRFTNNHWIYLAYVVEQNGKHNTRVSRFTYTNGILNEAKMMIDGPSGDDGAHFGCRLVFDRAGFLYASFGERHQKEKAQAQDSLHGKIVRLTDDGQIPKDNPFGASNAVFSIGHRNPQGLDIHPLNGKLYDSEHGPSGYDAEGGGDEINLIKAGANYGWPIIHHKLTKAGMEAPLVEYTPAVAPSGAAFYTGSLITQWKNDFFVAALRGQRLIRLRIDKDGAVTESEMLLQGKYGRLRDVGNSPDGSLLVLTDDGRLIRLSPQ